MSNGKVPMPASGQDSPKKHADGVGQVDSHERSVGGESGGGSYDNPYTGKEARGESGKFEGGQSVQGYYGSGQLDGEKADQAEPGTVGQGGDVGTGSDRLPIATPGNKPHQVTESGRTFEVVQASGVAEAEVNGKIGTDAAYEDEQNSSGSG